jgi:hypothetical protein
MKRKVLLLFLLLSSAEIIVAELLKNFNPTETICCKRGKRGHRGPRGRSGRDASCGLGELFLNAQMMFWFDEGAFPPNVVLDPYSPIETFIMAWTLVPFGAQLGLPPIGANFNIPIDLDRTKPVTAVIDVLVDSSAQVVGDQAKLQINMDYQPNNGLIGSTPPATGFADTQLSADFTVIFAVPAGSNNMRHISVPVILDQTKIDGEWAFIGVQRVAPLANEYSANLYLSAISIQYSRICS